VLSKLHGQYGRGELLAINVKRGQVAYRHQDVGVRRRPFRAGGGMVHFGRHSLPVLI